MVRVQRSSRVGVALIAALGLVALAATAGLPWRLTEFDFPVGARLTVAASGVALLLVAGRSPRTGGVATTTAWLGALVLLYPSLVALWAWQPGNPVAETVGATAHIPTLILAQLIPVLAASSIAARRHRRWEVAVVLVPLLSVACGMISDAGLPAAQPLGSALWLSSLLPAPVATCAAIRGTHGQTRRRLVLTVLAALAPVIVIVWCLTLGAIADSLGFGAAVSLSILMVGFAAGSASSGLFSCSAIARPVRTRTLMGLAAGLSAAIALVLGALVALAATSAAVAPGAAVALGAGVAVVVGALWLVGRAAIVRFVEPESRLRRELRLRGEVADGAHRESARAILRRLTGDPALELHLLVAETETTVGDPVTDASARAPASADRRTTVLLRDPDGTACAVAVAAPHASARLAALGDLGELTRPALAEARLAEAQERAARAVDAERTRLARNLHDGLQGRLLGLALNLQLSGDALADPTARLLVNDTVDALRSLVEEVRRFGDGQLPTVLSAEGLAPALRSLLAPVASMVDLDIPETRLPPAVEATAYFVVGEAVTNALKHADARRIGVTGSRDAGGAVTVTVRDDGSGGADPRAGAGLRGLSERVSVVGGVFTVRGGEASGTIVEAMLPCG